MMKTETKKLELDNRYKQLLRKRIGAGQVKPKGVEIASTIEHVTPLGRFSKYGTANFTHSQNYIDKYQVDKPAKMNMGKSSK